MRWHQLVGAYVIPWKIVIPRFHNGSQWSGNPGVHTLCSSLPYCTGLACVISRIWWKYFRDGVIKDNSASVSIPLSLSRMNSFGESQWPCDEQCYAEAHKWGTEAMPNGHVWESTKAAPSAPANLQMTGVPADILSTISWEILSQTHPTCTPGLLNLS